MNVSHQVGLRRPLGCAYSSPRRAIARLTTEQRELVDTCGGQGAQLIDHEDPNEAELADFFCWWLCRLGTVRLNEASPLQPRDEKKSNNGMQS